MTKKRGSKSDTLFDKKEPSFGGTFLVPKKEQDQRQGFLISALGRKRINPLLLEGGGGTFFTRGFQRGSPPYPK